MTQDGTLKDLAIVSESLVATGTYDCSELQGHGLMTLTGPGQASWKASDDDGGGQFATITGFLPQTECAGSGSCDVTAPSPQIICVTAATCPPGGTLSSTVTIGAFQSGALAPDKPVTVTFLSSSKAHDRSGSWCQGANGHTKTGMTNSIGLFAFTYTTAGKNPPPIPSFCIIRAKVGNATIISAIDQTNDPAPYKVTASPTPVTRYNLPSDKAYLHLYVKNPGHTPSYVNNDATTIYSEIPSKVGACGAIAPAVRKTANHGRATLVYEPSTIGGTSSHPVWCQLIGQEADTGATSNKVIIFQKT